jgi:hypothetical protein
VRRRGICQFRFLIRGRLSTTREFFSSFEIATGLSSEGGLDDVIGFLKGALIANIIY